MSSIKAALKAAKGALDAQQYDEAIEKANEVLKSDGKNYFARLFLGRALDRKGQKQEAAQAYQAAAKLKPDDDQAWIGLRSVYETQGPNKLKEYISVTRKLTEIYANSDDKDRCFAALDKVIQFAKNHGSKLQYAAALELQLPDSPAYDCLEGRIPRPAYTYITIADVLEAEEKSRINREIGERRTRIGARIAQVTVEVKLEVLGTSKLEEIYQNIIDWTSDDETRRQYEERLLQRAVEVLEVLPPQEKGTKLVQVQKLAHDMVIIEHPFEPAWNIEIEWQDGDSLAEWDQLTLRQYIAFFPDSGLSKVLNGFLESEISPFPAKAAEKKEDTADTEAEEETLAPEDRLHSALAHRIMATFYSHLEEHQLAVDIARDGISLTQAIADGCGLSVQKNLDDLRCILANHPQAKAIFHEILRRRQDLTPALLGIGLILQEEQDYTSAISFLAKAHERDPYNAQIFSELAWSKALNGDYQSALPDLLQALSALSPTEPRLRDLRAQILHRIGACQWELNPTRLARKDRSGAYTNFLASIKANINHAPPYTALGIYYADYARDRKRARQCFQKAFELSAAETLAAERLAKDYADLRDWDVVEMIARRVIDSGYAKPAPGSRRKGLSWPFAALGVVQINRADYPGAIVSFLASVRIDPGEYHSYVGLGEAYHNSGRYNSAARTLRYAESPDDGVEMRKPEETWFAEYMLANVNRELGLFDEAIEMYEAIALLQTLVDRAWRNIEVGFFGRAFDSAVGALAVAARIAKTKPDAFNLWKSARLSEVPFENIIALLKKGVEVSQYEFFADVDGVDGSCLEMPKEEDGVSITIIQLRRCVEAAILAQKRGIMHTLQDIHAQAVAWYNLGWTEYRAHTLLERYSSAEPRLKKSLRAAMRCFKRAIELEASNSEFWCSLGVVTTTLNAKVAQHALVRSININERNVRAWTNLGALYLIHKDYELAHQAFTRAQSTDPDYANAWVGEGILAGLCGDRKEALQHFTHAFELAESSSKLTKEMFSVTSFDAVVDEAHKSVQPNATQDVVRPLFALRQLGLQVADDAVFSHLRTLYLERVQDHEHAALDLDILSSRFEEEYEATESTQSMLRFAQAKADAARNKLALRDFESAIDDADLATQLAEGDEEDEDESSKGTETAKDMQRIRLSARLTQGLARYYQSDMDGALAAFRAALHDSASSPDVVCLLAEVLWAKGGPGSDERTVAKEQLFAAIERVPEHVGTVVRLGVMAAIEADEAAAEAVQVELLGMRMREDLDEGTRARVERVLDALVELVGGGEAGAERRSAVLTSVMISPGMPHGWMEVAELGEEAGMEGETRFAREMAVTTAWRAVPPRGTLGPEELARALADEGTVASAQRAVMAAPWDVAGWTALSRRVVA
ncbi:putative antiviral protein [Eremomyces bilateralis CBS 781.70]|uniref:Antiviral protein n=1 Tax=Eremomyces bilateralis CBS 781.70 TaxID=1392243 RepID=A0A6G1FYI5_9PEZI|nr:putative antiviral protein [Eremomyces bilateralis CBS 781.70]KAF1810629.1 putative antiviral protein [Eremomyces bilateralis CBS 781.70]